MTTPRMNMHQISHAPSSRPSTHNALTCLSPRCAVIGLIPFHLIPPPAGPPPEPERKPPRAAAVAVAAAAVAAEVVVAAAAAAAAGRGVSWGASWTRPLSSLSSWSCAFPCRRRREVPAAVSFCSGGGGSAPSGGTGRGRWRRRGGRGRRESLRRCRWWWGWRPALLASRAWSRAHVGG